jgi:hypothetical protein
MDQATINATYYLIATRSLGSYGRYRRVLKKCAAPCVPYVGVSLMDLTFIEEVSKSSSFGRKPPRIVHRNIDRAIPTILAI